MIDRRALYLLFAILIGAFVAIGIMLALGD